MNKWHRRFLRLAREVSTYSKDPSTKVGVIGVSPDRDDIIIAYNGLPRKLLDRQEILNDREQKLTRILHAEINLIIHAKRSLDKYTLFSWPLQPCSNCTSAIIQAGFTKIVSVENSVERWQESFKVSRELLKEVGIPLILYKQEQLDG